MNARFWAWSSGPEGGWVKLCLQPGQRLMHVGGGPTEEGYHYFCETWEHVHEGVLNRYVSAARDCDGRFDHGGERFCFLEELAETSLPGH